jgi:hypothetical protein
MINNEIQSATASTVGTEVNSVYQHKNSNCKSIRVVFAGGPFGTQFIEEFVEKLAIRLICHESIKFILVTGGTKKRIDENKIYVDFLAANAAKNCIEEMEMDIEERIKTVLPKQKNPNYERFFIGEIIYAAGRGKNRREEVVKNFCDIIITIGGRKSAIPDYMSFAQKYKKPILPLPFAGGKSFKKWHENRKKICNIFSINDKETFLIEKDLTTSTIDDKIELFVNLIKRASFSAIQEGTSKPPSPKNQPSNFKIIIERYWSNRPLVKKAIYFLVIVLLFPVVLMIWQNTHSNKNTSKIIENDDENTDTILTKIDDVKKSIDSQESRKSEIPAGETVFERTQNTLNSYEEKKKQYHYKKIHELGDSFVDSLTGATLGVSKISSDYTAFTTITLPGQNTKTLKNTSPGKVWNFKYSGNTYNLIMVKIDWVTSTFTAEVREVRD